MRKSLDFILEATLKLLGHIQDCRLLALGDSTSPYLIDQSSLSLDIPECDGGSLGLCSLKIR